MAPAGTGERRSQPPKKIPEITALLPAVRVAVIMHEAPAATDTEKCSQAPWLNAVVSERVWTTDPHVTVTVWRRADVSQSSTYTLMRPENAVLKSIRTRTSVLCQYAAARRRDWAASSSARTCVVDDDQRWRPPCSSVRVAPVSETTSEELFHAARR
jgi:hypothetical protein